MATLFILALVTIPVVAFVVLWLVVLEIVSGKRADDPLQKPENWGEQ